MESFIKKDHTLLEDYSIDELSLTLIERRKRLHELAVEINQWEDDSSTSKQVIENHSISLTPVAPPLVFDQFNRTPKRQIKSNNSSPAVNSNKENKTPTNPSTTNKKIFTPTSNEILNAAQRILTKRQSNNSLTNESVVKNMKTKFENMTHDQDDSLVQLTPKSIIKKFEQMSGNSNAKIPKLKTTSSTSVNHPNSNPKPIIESNELIKKEETNNLNETCLINTENIKPKSIIEKFESLVKSNNLCQDTDKKPLVINRNNFNNNSNNNIVQNPPTYSCSLTYVSSMRSSDESEQPKDDATSLFEDTSEDEDPSAYEDCNSPSNTQEGSVTSCLPDEETEQDIEQEEDEYIYEDSLEEDDDDEDDDDDDENYESIHEPEIIDNSKSHINEPIVTEDLYKPIEKKNDSPKASKEITTDLDQPKLNITNETALFSIKEYRKQKKTLNGSRRSSLAKKISNSKLLPTNQKQQLNLPNISEENNENKKLKNMERIKELEELIKQEENVIHQTGIALERCITDPQFAGTNEHIECNRLLLISCQKKQAYSTEIIRLKRLASSETNARRNSCLLNSDSDLTGLLIFSDLQLPIKESYINRLRSGDEKRIFYFLCLIRNGIQVLQTQVISVQELISTRDNSLIFPNRMAINNVDINFKVKIDIYLLEVQALKTIKPSSSNVTNKFFSPFKFHNSSHSTSASNQTTSKSNICAKTSNFIHVDTIEITHKEISKNKFKLSLTSSSIPLTGFLQMNVRCMPSKSIELKGFMSLFEESSNIGNWDRRWCFLNNYNISYWRYPDDEFKNGPLGIINLTKVISDKVSILPRELCARKNTIELLVQDDSSSSTSTSEDNKKYKRFRLSADSKDQAIDWVTNLNFALSNLRIWNIKN